VAVRFQRLRQAPNSTAVQRRR